MVKPSRLVSTAAVNQIFDTKPYWSDTELTNEVLTQEQLIYREFGNPIIRTISEVDIEYGKYYTGERNIYRVDTVYYGTQDTKTELTEDNLYTVSTTSGMITLLTAAGSVGDLSAGTMLWMDYVPGIYSRLCALRVLREMFEQTDAVSGQDLSKELRVIDRKLATIEQLVTDKLGPLITSDFQFYDRFYGVNTRRLRQDHDKNKYL